MTGLSGRERHLRWSLSSVFPKRMKRIPGPVSTHCQKRNLLVIFVAGNAGGVRIQHRPSVHQKPVLMMAVTQLDAREPPAVHRSLHGKGLPMVKIAHQFNRFGVRCSAIKVNGPE